MVSIDKAKCINCGLCSTICPEAFEVKSDTEVVVKDPKSKASTIKEATDSCPVGAISE